MRRGYALGCASGGQRTPLYSWFSPPTPMVLGVELGSSGLQNKHLNPLNHLSSPCFQILKGGTIPGVNLWRLVLQGGIKCKATQQADKNLPKASNFPSVRKLSLNISSVPLFLPSSLPPIFSSSSSSLSFMVLGTKSRASWVLGKCPSTELPRPNHAAL